MENHIQKKPRVLIFYPYLMCSKQIVIGGAEFRIMQAMHLLKDLCEVTLAVNSLPNWQELNDVYGTFIKNEDIKILRINTRIFRQHFLSFCGKNYDLCIDGHDIDDFKVPALHFVVHGTFDQELVVFLKSRGLDIDDVYKPTISNSDRFKRVISFKRYVRSARRHFSLLVAPGRTKRQIIKSPNERVISNSVWLAEAVSECYEVPKLEVLYPPVVAEFPNPLWENREKGFVCIGRISPEKKVENLIKILDQVRKAGYSEIRLHLGGNIPENDYGKMIFDLIRKYPWIISYGDVSGEEKTKLIVSQRFALHGCTFEGFGISVAEYVKAGTIPIVPNTAGAAEIVPIEELQYGSTEEAVQKIIKLLNNPERQIFLHRKLIETGKRFTLESFQESFKAIVFDELDKRGFVLGNQ